MEGSFDAASLLKLHTRLEEDAEFLEAEHWGLFDQCLHVLDSQDKEARLLGKDTAKRTKGILM